MAGLRAALDTPLGRKVAVGALTLSATGLAFISQNEGRELNAYKDVVGVVTICDGHTKTAKMGQTATNEICDALLKEDTREAQAAVKRLVKVKVTQSQYDAMVDFVFNLGEGNFASSTLLRKINADDCWGAGKEFPRWNMAKGKVWPGLTKRANARKVMWEYGCSLSGT